MPYFSLNSQQLKRNKYIRYWLYSILFLLLVIVLVGGITRMTDSGLSITEWKPIYGIIPPLNLAQWQQEFFQYQQIAQYKIFNQGMTLEEFKKIFWWEWIHRFLARLVGFLVIVPLLYFWITKKLNKALKRRLLFILAIGALQGFIGWWMVSSGVGNSSLIFVSHYRLAIHLTFAAVLIFLVFSLACQLIHKNYLFAPKSVRIGSGIIIFLIIVQIYLGALVAGLRAGYIDTSWPLMTGGFLPADLFPSNPWWVSLFEDKLTVQFVHRMFAYLLVIIVGWHSFWTSQVVPASRHSKSALYLFLVVLLQAIIGVCTLLTDISIEWALLHQLIAFVVLIFAVVHRQIAKGDNIKILL
ncbi:COX15/CtaA family protein [Bartonella sp. DGB1]|uniref:COX15/CtaA family protein n=1 Tax=Bartonella sp. DGB1 TaxID=3239807 RepID=UPI0035237FBE